MQDDVEAVVVARALEGLLVALVAGVEGAARVALVRTGAAREGFVLVPREGPALVQRVRAPFDDTKNLREVRRPAGSSPRFVRVEPRLADERRLDDAAVDDGRAAERFGQRRVQGVDELVRRVEGGARRQRADVALGPRRGLEGVRDAQPGVELRGEGVPQARASSDHHRARRPEARLARAVVPFDNHAVGYQGLARTTATVEQQRPRVLEEAGHRLLFRAVELERLTSRAAEGLDGRQARGEPVPLRHARL